MSAPTHAFAKLSTVPPVLPMTARFDMPFDCASCSLPPSITWLFPGSTLSEPRTVGRDGREIEGWQSGPEPGLTPADRAVIGHRELHQLRRAKEALSRTGLGRPPFSPAHTPPRRRCGFGRFAAGFVAPARDCPLVDPEGEAPSAHQRAVVLRPVAGPRAQC